MSRPTQIIIDSNALLHNIAKIRALAPGKKLITMVKANAYGCGLNKVVPVLEGQVDALGVACLEEAMSIRAMGMKTQCILFEGVFTSEEWQLVSQQEFPCVIHQQRQLDWLLNTPLPKPVSIWIKVNTGMNRLGFPPSEVSRVIKQLKQCSWVNHALSLMTHLACADQPEREQNQQQISLFNSIELSGVSQRSIANSAAILSFPETHADAVRAGIMLYGVSPFSEQTGQNLGLKPVMRFVSEITAIHHNPPFSFVGYGGTWHSQQSSIVGIIPVGYGDGYPRHLSSNTPVWVNGWEVPIIGRVSMDMMAVDLTAHPEIQIGDAVELWGTQIAVERVAASAGTIAYELLCQITERPRLL
ncbi:alanine racemase [Legionella sp. km772]|uniref:alanine racemase n=1 Tax=Legionella sp. km772 TaxID=2498111 RepID=UPI000F8D1E1E|nr:alanine racemase [Legionella sp. km772]RUR09007.1 alanine racemase [Legionella sp. km772]